MNCILVLVLVCVQALAVSEDGRYLVSGGFDCTVCVFSTSNLCLCHAHPPCLSRIRSLHLSKDQRFVTCSVKKIGIVQTCLPRIVLTVGLYLLAWLLAAFQPSPPTAG